MFFFNEGDRVQIILPELNLEAGARDEYPHLGMGTVAIPTKKTMAFEPEFQKKTEKKAKKTMKKSKKEKVPELGVQVVAREVIEPDLRKRDALRDERQVWVKLDRLFLRGKRDETPWRKKDNARTIAELAVPEWLLKPLEPEEDPLAPRA